MTSLPTRLTAGQMAEIVAHATAYEPTKYDTPYLALCAAERQLLLAHVAALEGEALELRAVAYNDTQSKLIEALEADLAACRRDQARMDWIERDAHLVGWDNEGERLVVRADDGREATGDTFRDAIDAQLAALSAQAGAT